MNKETLKNILLSLAFVSIVFGGINACSQNKHQVAGQILDIGLIAAEFPQYRSDYVSLRSQLLPYESLFQRSEWFALAQFDEAIVGLHQQFALLQSNPEIAADPKFLAAFILELDNAVRYYPAAKQAMLAHLNTLPVEIQKLALNLQGLEPRLARVYSRLEPQVLDGKDVTQQALTILRTLHQVGVI